MGTTTLRPDGIIANVSNLWVTYGSPSPNTLDQATKDNVNTTGARWPTATGVYGNTLQLSLSTFTVPLKAQIRSVTPRLRAAGGANVNGFPFGYLIARGSLVSPSNDFPAGAVMTTYTGTTLTTRSDGAPWTQADVDALEIDVTVRGDNTTTFDVEEAYVDVVYNEAPVASSVGLTSNITSLPTVTWTYTDPENDVQERYQVKIYQGTGTVSDPDNTAAYYDSGEVFSLVNRHQVTASLPASAVGVSYRVYVKVADVGSSGRYGLWATATFTLVVDVPATPEILTWSDAGLARLGIMVQGNDNILQHNADDFESFNTEWIAITNNTTSRQTSQVLHGGGALQLSSTASGNMSSGTNTGFRGVVSPGRMYRGLFWMKAAASSRLVRADLTWYTAGGASISTSNGLVGVDTTTGWTVFTVSGIAPPTAATVQLVVTVFATGGAAEIHYLDEALIAPVPIRNMLPFNTSSMEIDVSGWVAASQATITQTQTFVYEGADALLITATGAAPTVSTLTGTSGIAVTPGRSYTFTTLTRAGVASRNGTPGIIWYTAAGAVVSTSTGSPITTGLGSWTLAIVTATAPATAAFAASQLAWSGCSVNDTFYADRAQLFIASTNLLVPNTASIETDATGWGSTTNCAVARTTAQFLDGVASLSLTSSASGTMSVKSAPLTMLNVTPGTSYTGFASFRSAVSARTVSVNINWRDASTAIISTTSGTGVTDATTGWVQATVVGVAPAGAVYATIEAQVAATGAGAEVHYVDAVMFMLTADVTWSVGDAAMIGTYVIIERSTDNGVTWTQVRGAYGFNVTTLVGSQYDAPATQTFYLYDYEVLRSIGVLYRARTIDQGNHVSLNVTAPAVSQLASGWWLKDPLAPGLNHQIEAMPPFDFTRKKPTSVFDPLGRNVSITTTDGVKGIAGTLGVRCQSKARYDKLEAILSNGRTLLLEDIFGRSWYISQAGDSSWSFIRAQPTSQETTSLRYLHEIQIPFVQVGSPAGDLITAGTPVP